MTYVANCAHPVNITTVFEDKLLSSGGTLLRNSAFFQKEAIMLVHADNLSLFNMRAFKDKFYSRDKDVHITMMTFHTDAPETCGIVELDERGLVRAFHEKVKTSPSNLANAAVYILAPTVIDFIASLRREVVDFSTEVLPHFMGRINTFHNEVYHRDIGTVESLTAARSEYPPAVAKQCPSEIGDISA